MQKLTECSPPDLIHTPTKLGKEGFPTHQEAWKTMCDLRDEGLVKSIGVSNFRVSDLEKVSKMSKSPLELGTMIDPQLPAQTLEGARYPITCNQIEFHPFVSKSLAPLAEFCEHQEDATRPASHLTRGLDSPQA